MEGRGGEGRVNRGKGRGRGGERMGKEGKRDGGEGDWSTGADTCRPTSCSHDI